VLFGNRWRLATHTHAAAWVVGILMHEKCSFMRKEAFTTHPVYACTTLLVRNCAHLQLAEGAHCLNMDVLHTYLPINLWLRFLGSTLIGH
jgi:hypothetical protein